MLPFWQSCWSIATYWPFFPMNGDRELARHSHGNTKWPSNWNPYNYFLETGHWLLSAIHHMSWIIIVLFHLQLIVVVSLDGRRDLIRSIDSRLHHFMWLWVGSGRLWFGSTSSIIFCARTNSFKKFVQCFASWLGQWRLKRLVVTPLLSSIELVYHNNHNSIASCNDSRVFVKLQCPNQLAKHCMNNNIAEPTCKALYEQ